MNARRLVASRREVPVRTFQYFAPESVQEAIEFLQERGSGSRPLAGGTDLVVQMKEGSTKFPLPSSLVSLRRVQELKGVEFSEAEGLRIGAGATMAELAASADLRDRFSAIAEGAAVVGSLQTMNMATVGGNFCNAAPSADTVPPLMVFEADAIITGPSSQRWLPLDRFFFAPGKTALSPYDLLLELRALAPAAGTGSAYLRHTPRKRMDIAVVGVAALLTLGTGGMIEKARIALGAVAPTPIRAPEAEAVLEGKIVSEALFKRAAEAAADAAQPISDVRASADYRRHLVRTLTERCLQEAARRARARFVLWSE